MKKVLLCYANEAYRTEQKLCCFSAVHFAGFDECIAYGPQDIDREFKQHNAAILSYSRGNGLWLWKPYCILMALQQVEEGDLVFYSDSGAFFLRSFCRIFDEIQEKKFWITELPLLERQFTKKETFEQMNCVERQIMDSNQYSASFVGIVKSKETIRLVERWLEYCCGEEIISPTVFGSPNENTFFEHREDQSVLSLLCKKNHIIGMGDISEYGILPELYFIHPNIEFNPIKKRNIRVPYIFHYRRRKDMIKRLVNVGFFLLLPNKISRRLILERNRRFSYSEGPLKDKNCAKRWDNS